MRLETIGEQIRIVKPGGEVDHMKLVSENADMAIFEDEQGFLHLIVKENQDE